ncbi:MAG: CsbD family protein [Planctomycetaceae bacterium]|nr:CsbD family protein [Planctomycetaceae bacterium]
MLTREELQGTWTQLKGQVRERWGQITDDELQQVHGDAEQFMGFLQKKTGQSRPELEKFVRQAMDKGKQAMDQGKNTVQQVADTARDYAQRAGQSVREGYEAVEHNVEEGYEEAQEMVRARPMESLTAAFGAGLVAGVLVSLMLRSSRA